MNRKSRIARSASFLSKRIEARKLPGHCPRCGREHDEMASGYRHCHQCRAVKKAWKLKKKGEQLPVIGEIQANAILVKVAEIERRIAAHEKSNVMLRAKLKKAYSSGLRRGEKKERERLAVAMASNTAKPWDCWTDEIDMDEKKLQFHRFAKACGG